MVIISPPPRGRNDLVSSIAKHFVLVTVKASCDVSKVDLIIREESHYAPHASYLGVIIIFVHQLFSPNAFFKAQICNYLLIYQTYVQTNLPSNWKVFQRGISQTNVPFEQSEVVDRRKLGIYILKLHYFICL